MDMHLLKRAAEKITMQSDMQQRLVEKCRAESLGETVEYYTFFVDAQVVKPKNRYVRYVFACLATIVLFAMLTVTGILLYNGVEIEVGTYEIGTAQCEQILQDMQEAFETTRKAGSGKILIEQPNAIGRTMEGEVIFDDYHFDPGTQCFSYYYIVSGKQAYVKKNQGYYEGYYFVKEGNWSEGKNALRDTPGWDAGYWTSYLLLDGVSGGYYTISNLLEVTVSKKGENTIYLLDCGTYGYRRIVVDKNQIVRQGQFLDKDMKVTRQCRFEPCQIQQVETPYDEDIEALKKTKLDLDADGTAEDIAVNYLEDGVQVTVNESILLLKYGKELPEHYYFVPMEDMKRFREQASETGAIILTLQVGKELEEQRYHGDVSDYIFCVIGYDGAEAYLLGNYGGMEFDASGADSFYMRRFNKETLSYEFLDFIYDRENKMLIEKEL